MGKREVYFIEDLPQIGTRYYGIVDQGTNIVEVRPTSLCPLNCAFCSVAAGPYEGRRWAEFVVKREALIESLSRVVKFKGGGVEVHIDGMGEPAVYPELVDLVQDISAIPGVKTISMQSRLFTLRERTLEELAEAGLSRVNLSLDAMNSEVARKLAGVDYYSAERARSLAEYALANTRMDVIVSPVWVPGLNDDEIPEIIKWASSAGLGKRWPPVLIQKYIPHKRGRNPRGVKPVDWGHFWRKLREWERQTGVKLDWRGENPFGIEKRAPLPKPLAAGRRVKVRVIGRGIFRGEYLGVPVNTSGDPLLDRAITLLSERSLEPGVEVLARIIEDENNILLARAELVFL